MDYQITVTVAAGTTEANAREDTLEIAPGIINLVYLKARRGAANLVNVRIYWGENLLYPTSPDEWYHLDFFPIQFRDWVIIDDFPFELTIKSWNEDAKFQHTFTVRVNIWPLELFVSPVIVEETIPTPWPELPQE